MEILKASALKLKLITAAENPSYLKIVLLHPITAASSVHTCQNNNNIIIIELCRDQGGVRT